MRHGDETEEAVNVAHSNNNNRHPHFPRSVSQVSVSGVLCFGFHGDEGLAHVVCLSGLAVTGHWKSVYPVQKCLQARSAAPAEPFLLQAVEETDVLHKPPLKMQRALTSCI